MKSTRGRSLKYILNGAACDVTEHHVNMLTSRVQQINKI